jgi:hypothetical protein
LNRAVRQVVALDRELARSTAGLVWNVKYTVWTATPASAAMSAMVVAM